MGTHHGKLGVVKIGAAVVAETHRWSYKEQVSTADDTAQGDTSETHLVGISNWEGSISCHYDPADSAGQEAMTVGASVTVNMYPEGAGSGLKYRTGTASITDISVETDKAGVVSRDFTLKGNGALGHATV